jgi:hypothetical protein
VTVGIRVQVCEAPAAPEWRVGGCGETIAAELRTGVLIEC